MDIEAINRVYNPDTRCKATYLDDDGFPTQGLMIEPPQPSLMGGFFVFINNYATRITIDRVVNVEDTKRLWA